MVTKKQMVKDGLNKVGHAVKGKVKAVRDLFEFRTKHNKVAPKIQCRGNNGESLFLQHESGQRLSTKQELYPASKMGTNERNYKPSPQGPNWLYSAVDGRCYRTDPPIMGPVRTFQRQEAVNAQQSFYSGNQTHTCIPSPSMHTPSPASHTTSMTSLRGRNLSTSLPSSLPSHTESSYLYQDSRSPQRRYSVDYSNKHRSLHQMPRPTLGYPEENISRRSSCSPLWSTTASQNMWGQREAYGSSDCMETHHYGPNTLKDSFIEHKDYEMKSSNRQREICRSYPESLNTKGVDYFQEGLQYGRPKSPLNSSQRCQSTPSLTSEVSSISVKGLDKDAYANNVYTTGTVNNGPVYINHFHGENELAEEQLKEEKTRPLKCSDSLQEVVIDNIEDTLAKHSVMHMSRKKEMTNKNTSSKKKTTNGEENISTNIAQCVRRQFSVIFLNHFYTWIARGSVLYAAATVIQVCSGSITCIVIVIFVARKVLNHISVKCSQSNQTKEDVHFTV